MKSVVAAGGYVIEPERILEQARHAQKEGHASCFFQLVFDFSDTTVLTVVDLFTEEMPTKSVTNDAEFVTRTAWDYVQKVMDQEDIPIIYRDTEGNWDELRHYKGNFACFRPLNTTDMDVAIRTVAALRELERLEQDKQSN